MHGVAVVAVDGGLEHEDLQWLKILGNKNPEGCIGRLFYKTEKKINKIINYSKGHPLRWDTGDEKISSFALGGGYAHRSSLDKYFSKISHKQNKS